MDKMKKKKYNPFMMWGSYVGALLMPIVLNFSNIITRFQRNCVPLWEGSSDLICTYVYRFFGGFIGLGEVGKFFVVIFIPVIFGFLLGWGIHSLVRYLKK